MNALLKNLPTAKHLGIAAALAFLMLLTRGSHVLTAVSLPDASLAIFLLGGLLLKRSGWFAVFFVLGTVIDFGAAALDPIQGFCLTDGYWGLIPAYGAMWLGGLWLSTKPDAFAPFAYTVTGLVTTFAAFVISTQTYYLFSGRFPNTGVLETMQYGWNYLPGWMGFAAMYFAIIWAVARLLRNTHFMRSIRA